MRRISDQILRRASRRKSTEFGSMVDGSKINMLVRSVEAMREQMSQEMKLLRQEMGQLASEVGRMVRHEGLELIEKTLPASLSCNLPPTRLRRFTPLCSSAPLQLADWSRAKTSRCIFRTSVYTV